MIVYEATKTIFTQDVVGGEIEDIIHDQFQQRLGRRVGQSEQDSWRNSLMYMNQVVADSSIPDDAGVFVECQLPYSSKRIDFIITGKDDDDTDQVIIIELKQWSEAQMTSKDAIVRVRFAHGEAEVSHPSYQAWSYAAYLQDFNEHVYTGDVSLKPCAFLHNYPSDGVIDHPFYADHISKAPLFLRKDQLKLREFIKQYVKQGDKGAAMFRIDKGQIKPSKSLSDSLVSMLDGNQEFIMLDEQKVVYETALELGCREEERKRVLIVKGGPGTGKSVVAINLLVEFIKRERMTMYVTKNAAPRDVYQSLLTKSMTKTRFSALFKGSGTFIDSVKDVFDVLVVDEAHRLNEKTGFFRKGENQIKEIINAAKTSVFFIDEDQRIHMRDIGSVSEIQHWAYFHGAEIQELELPSQFRCNGSDGYIAWLDNTLQIRETANTDLADISYDFRVYDSPVKLDSTIRSFNDLNNKARVVAGYCWDWPSKKDSSAFDIVIDEFDYKRQWNLEEYGNTWLINPSSVNEVGCIHTCQGLELEYVGVIIGDDLVVRNGQVITQPDRRSKQDQSIYGWKKQYREDPAGTLMLIDGLIKNTYRTLMSRGMKGCFLYCTDEETREYFRAFVT